MNKKFIRSKTSANIKSNVECGDGVKHKRQIYTSHRSTSYGYNSKSKRNIVRLLSIHSEGDTEEKQYKGIIKVSVNICLVHKLGTIPL
jgi:hypothetical protein